MPRRLNALLALAGLSLALTGCGGGSNTTVTNPDGTALESTLRVTIIQVNSTEKVACVTANSSQAISCDWDNKITSP